LRVHVRKKKGGSEELADNDHSGCCWCALGVFSPRVRWVGIKLKKTGEAEGGKGGNDRIVLLQNTEDSVIFGRLNGRQGVLRKGCEDREKKKHTQAKPSRGTRSLRRKSARGIVKEDDCADQGDERKEKIAAE